ncbi:hypothetical protein ACFQOZ_15755 [Comamonas endophytica]
MPENSLPQPGPIEVDEGQWLVPWSADDVPHTVPLIAAAGVSICQPLSNGTTAAIARQYMSEAKNEAISLDDDCYHLHDLINSCDGGPMTVPHPDRLLPAEFGVPDKLRNWAQAMSGGLTAFQSALDEMLAAPAVPAAPAAPEAASMAAVAGVPKSDFAAQSVGTTGAAYLCLKALREHPELATTYKYTVSRIRTRISESKAKLEQIEYRLDWLKGRHDVEARMTMVQHARAQKLRSLRFEAESVAISGRAAMVAPGRKVRLSDGGLRAQVLGLAERAKTAFDAFLTHAGAALGWIYAFFGPATDDGRDAARLHEQQHAKRIESTLRALQTIAPHSLLNNKLCLEAQAMLRAIKAGVAHREYPEVGKQFIMGENLVRALMSAKVPSFGSIAYDGANAHGGLNAVSSTLATARAVAWYLDAIADLDADARRASPGTPEVKRRGNSLIVADPQRRLAGFLMSAPTAHTAIMAGRKDAALSTAITIDDHRAGMPGGMHSMQIESVVDEESNTVGLRLSFTAQGDRPVYQPLANEARVMDRMRTAPHMSRAPLPAVSQDYSGWSVDRLAAHFQALKEQVRQEAIVFKADQRLLLDIAVPGMPQLVANYA